MHGTILVRTIRPAAAAPRLGGAPDAGMRGA